MEETICYKCGVSITTPIVNAVHPLCGECEIAFEAWLNTQVNLFGGKNA